MTTTPPRYRVLLPGDPAPWFRQRSTSNPRHAFDTSGGRWIVLCFFATAADPLSREALRLLDERRDLFDDTHMSFFGVSLDPQDEAIGRVDQCLPGIRMFWDFDGKASRAYGVVPIDPAPGPASVDAQRLWYVLDPMLRVRAVIPFSAEDGGRAAVAAVLDCLPPVPRYTGLDVHPPILVLPEVFEPAFCRTLVALYERHGGEDSGFMREIDGRTVGLIDYGHKRRTDHTLTDEAMIEETRLRVRRRVVPEILKAHQFEVTRMERYIVACYEAAHRGHFRSHRDNTTKGTAHRRFAVSINLNDDFEGGEISFPEFGPRRYKAPAGAAVVFSCTLLHQVSPMVAGRRFAFLPFLYDDVSARQREANNAFLGDGIGAYVENAARAH
ncbi:MAG: redoxin domain-containing protein [Alphaproteobacteria bacterium]|nr:redoxin domain-containing protein [Alphaproteobacteria bacterium]